MASKQQHIYLDELLVHPGETILEIIEDRNISQKELAVRTGFSEKHISTVINGKKNISAEFAAKLEYVLGVPASFWRNLQTNYDLEVVAFNEKHNITDEERKIAKEVKETVEQITNQTIKAKNNSGAVFQLRQILGVSNLSAISSLNQAQYRVQFAKNTSENIMYIWQYLCEKKVENQTKEELNIDKLVKSLEEIKMVMHEDSQKHIKLIQEILNSCGILFTVEKHAKNTPIKGLTVKTKSNQVMIALTIKGKFVDIFWFTLFHEIAHVIYGDYLKKYTDYEKYLEIEKRADDFAANMLINKQEYERFVKRGDFSVNSIRLFASDNNILPTIVFGRLMNDGYILWNLSSYRETYSWASNDD